MSQKRNRGGLHVAKDLTKEQRIALQKKRQRQALIKLSMIFFATIGILSASLMIYQYFKNPGIASQVIKMGTLDTSTLYEGVVFRNEKVIVSQNEGYVKYVAEEGEKLQKDGTVFIIVDQENLTMSEKEKEAFERYLYAEADNQKDTSTNQDERYYLDEDVKDKIESYYDNRYETGTKHIYKLRNKLDSSVTNRTNLYTEEQELTDVKQTMEASFNDYQIEIATEESGIISYLMDGAETRNALEAIQALTYQDYSQYKKTNRAINLAPNPIRLNEPIYKLISNNEWYIVTYIQSNEEDWVEGKKYNLNFEEINNERVTVTLISKKAEGKHTQLVFKSTSQLNHFLGARVVQFTIGNKSVSGLKIPVSAIVELNLIKIPSNYIFQQDDQYYVLRKAHDKIEKVLLEIQKSEDEFSYVIQDLTKDDTIQLKDVLVKKGTEETYTVSESAVISGVYVMNSQIARFKEIEIIAENKEYVLIKATTKSPVKEMDKIITNPSRIQNDQLLESRKITE